MTATQRATESFAPQAAWHAEWLVASGPPAIVAVPHGGRVWQSTAGYLTVAAAEGSDLRIAEDARLVVLFSGLLTNVAEISPAATQQDAARIVLGLIRARGEEAFAQLRGPFAVVVWERSTGILLAVRDQIGLEPLFYASAGRRGWLLSPSPDVLASQAGVSNALDAVAMGEWLCGWFPAVEDTAYRDIKRVPPASVARFPDVRVRRYWDPFERSSHLKWLGPKDLEQFEPLLRNAVKRASQNMAPAVFLSGGVDSIGVAVTLADLAGTERPLALSLAFPDEASNEEAIQTAVARRLDMDQVLLPFEKAVGPEGLLAEALSISESWPQPMWNVWLPAYVSLAAIARERGRQVVVTGRGGDEWLTISPYLLADQMKRGDVRGMWRFLQMRRRSNNMSMRSALRLAWLTACRPLASSAFDAAAPSLWAERRRRRLLSERPAWVAPDPAVRRAMEERLERSIEPARPEGGFYLREVRTALHHPAVAHDMEETQEFGRRHGLRMLHPFWDVDLIEMLYRVPPELLMADGRSKWLLRRRINERLPDLGLERRGKVSAAHVFGGVMAREAQAALSRLDGVKTLTGMGTVAGGVIESQPSRNDLTARAGSAGRLWTLLNLESWARRRA